MRLMPLFLDPARLKNPGLEFQIFDSGMRLMPLFLDPQGGEEGRAGSPLIKGGIDQGYLLGGTSGDPR